MEVSGSYLPTLDPEPQRDGSYDQPLILTPETIMYEVTLEDGRVITGPEGFGDQAAYDESQQL